MVMMRRMMGMIMMITTAVATLQAKAQDYYSVGEVEAVDVP